MRSKHIHEYKCERCGLEYYTTKSYQDVPRYCPLCSYKYFKYNKW